LQSLNAQNDANVISWLEERGLFK